MSTPENLGDSGLSTRVLAVVPCLNEEQHIEHVLDALMQEQDRVVLGIVVADGGSTDQTRSIVQRLSQADRRIVLMENPKRIQSAGINSAVRKYGAGFEFLLRVDAHAGYPDRFCETLLRVQKRTQADSVVVSMNTKGTTCIEKAAAAAQNSLLGNGGSAHRNEASDRWVDHGHHALISMDAFRTIGGYDETFSHNEDVEFDARLIDSGFHIFLTSEARVTYFPRGSLRGLFQQYFKIGGGRARNFLKNRKATRLRHLVLTAVAPALCFAILTPISPIFAIPALAWMLLCLGYGVALGVQLSDPCSAAAGAAAIAMQAGWSFGFFRGLIGEAIQRQSKITSGNRVSTT